jgi:hypothetical protein
LHPADLSTRGAQNNSPNGHGPLQGCRREEHGRPPDRPSHPPATPGHGQLTLLWSGQIICSLHTSGAPLDTAVVRAVPGGAARAPR